MANCKDEFLEAIQGHDLLCAKLIYKKTYHKEPDRIALLFPNFLQNEYNHFLQELDFEYDDGYGFQELFGIIWYKDGTWSERHVYDGAEEWVYKACPEIPKELKR